MVKVRTRGWREIVLGCVGLAALGALVVGCGGGGGSGSTGLVTSEGAVIDDVRREGTCGEFDGAPYCATDSPNAVAPGGQSLSLVAVTPTPVQTPTPTPRPHETETPAPEPTETQAAFPTSTPPVGPTSTSGVQPSATVPQRTATPGPARTSTPVRSATPARTGTPKPGPTSTAGSGGASVAAVVNGFDDGAACATAARPASSEDAWKTGELVPIDDSGETVVFPLPAGVSAPADVALLCFAEAPDELPAEVTTLADAGPTVVFVLPSSQ